MFAEIDRRKFLELTALSSFGLVFNGLAKLKQSQSLNILVLMPDQHGAKFSGAYEHPVVHTPNIDKLAERGVLFENAYCNFPLCVPSRMSFLTGQFIKNIEVWDNGVVLPSDKKTWAHVLSDLGYDVVLSGKMHFLGPDKLHGFRAQLAMDTGRAGPHLNWQDPSAKYGNGLQPYELRYSVGEMIERDRLPEEKAIEYIRDLKRKEKPWALFVGIHSPHRPWVVDPEVRDKYYPLDKIKLPDLPEGHLENQHPAHKRNRYMHTLPPFEFPAEEVRKNRQAYYCSITRMDQQVGRIISALESSGQTDNTLIIYSSDHGTFVGEHGLWQKSSFYDQASRVPLIFVWPGHFPQNKRISSVVSLVDVTATILDVAGAPNAIPLDGDSLINLIRGTDHNWKDEAFAEHYATRTDRPMAMLRKGRYKLNYYQHDYPELYDLVSDPGEFKNLALNEQYEDVLIELESELLSRWDPEIIRQKVIESQQRRWFNPETSKKYIEMIEKHPNS